MDTINVINLGPDQPAISMNPQCTPELIKRSRDERALSIVEQSKRLGFCVRFWEGEMEKFGHIGINKAFRKIVQWAKENKSPRVLIGEDDLLFSSPGAWKYYIDNIPDDYDTYLGGIYAGQLQGNRIINGYSGHSLIMIHERFYDFFLSANPNDHLDRWLGNTAFKHQYIVCLPYVVYQISKGYSDNHKRMVSHNSYLKEMNLYKG